MHPALSLERRLGAPLLGGRKVKNPQERTRAVVRDRLVSQPLAVLDGTPTSIAILTEDAKISWATEDMAAAFDIHPLQIVGRDWAHLYALPPTDTLRTDRLLRAQAHDYAAIRLFFPGDDHAFDVYCRPLLNAQDAVQSILIIANTESDHHDIEDRLANHSPVGLRLLQDGTYQIVSPRFQDLVRYGEVELLGTDLASFDIDADVPSAVDQDQLSSQGRNFSLDAFRLAGKARDTRWLLLSIPTVETPWGAEPLEDWIIVTDLKPGDRSEKTVATSGRAIAFDRSRSQREMLRHRATEIVDDISRYAGALHLTVWLRDEDIGNLRVVTTCANGPRAIQAASVLRTGEPALGYWKRALIVQTQTLTDHQGTLSIASIPITTGDITYGAIDAIAQVGRYFTTKQIDALAAAAERISLLLEEIASPQGHRTDAARSLDTLVLFAGGNDDDPHTDDDGPSAA